MDNILQNLSASPLIIIMVIFIGLLIVYFLFKQLLKFALLFLMILLAIGGYFYFKDPEKMPQHMMETLEKAKAETGKAVEKGRAIVEKGKQLTEGMDNLKVGKERKADTKAVRDSKGQK